MTTARRLIAASALFFASVAFAQIRSTQNTPYSATEKTIVVQTLSDGTHIKTETISFFARDSAGRTLRKSDVSFGHDQSMMQSSIFDPMTRTTIVWTSNSKHATRVHMPDPQSRAQAGFAALASGSTVGTVVAGGVASSAMTSAPPGAPANTRQRPEQHIEKLGTQSINGVLSEGSRTTTIYPIGFAGNDRPIEAVNETWFATDLHILIRGVFTDPRMGTRTTEVISLDRADPAPQLFQPPADYEIRDQNPNQ
ncbi:MAG: hypothetical protein JSS95_03775 [Acidobacteria bacterium]|nr:hypothetical protein [Acidobacteriota bacterium]